jgi:peptidoglycan-associated lipoprotein
LNPIKQLMARIYIFVLSLLISGPFVMAQPVNESTPEANRTAALELYEAGDYFNALTKLEKAYEDFKVEDYIYKMGMCAFHLRDYRGAERFFTRMMRRDKAGNYPDAQFWKARMMKMSGKYEEAIGEFNDILKSDADPEIKRRAQLELTGANMAVEAPELKRLTFTNAGKDLNTPGGEGSVFVAPDGQTLYYSSSSQNEVITLKDDAVEPLSRANRANWTQNKDEWAWSAMGELGEMVNREDYHTGSISISPDGQRMYFTRVIFRPDSLRQSQIYMSNNQGSDWGPAYEVKGVNGDWMSYFPCIGEHFGKEVLFFTADIPGGHGGKDIYYANRIDDLTFSDPINLGDVINGPGDEVSPFYHQGRLYFSSDSYASFGGMDIFRSDWDGSVWSEPANMGKGFNSATDDYNFSIDATGRKGALLSNRPEGKSLYARTCCDDIYTFDLAPVTIELIVTVLEGEQNRPLKGVPVQVIEMLRDKMGVTNTKVTESKGTISFSLETDKAFQIIAAVQGFFPDTLEFNTTGFKDNATIEKTLVILPEPRDPEFEIYTIEEPIRLNSIYYDYDDDKILPEAEPDLQLLTDLLNQYKDMVIELSSHTDARGNDDYNQQLSQRRAQSAKNWIVSKGIVADRIQAVGYGEQQILNHCANGVDCNDDEHRFNRRTEFKIISGPTTIQIEKKRLKGEQGSVAPQQNPRKKVVDPVNSARSQVAAIKDAAGDKKKRSH